MAVPRMAQLVNDLEPPGRIFPNVSPRWSTRWRARRCSRSGGGRPAAGHHREAERGGSSHLAELEQELAGTAGGRWPGPWTRTGAWSDEYQAAMAARLTGMSAELARLSWLRACPRPVCGSTAHPAPACPDGTEVSADDVAGLRETAATPPLTGGSGWRTAAAGSPPRRRPAPRWWAAAPPGHSTAAASCRGGADRQRGIRGLRRRPPRTGTGRPAGRAGRAGRGTAACGGGRREPPGNRRTKGPCRPWLPWRPSSVRCRAGPPVGGGSARAALRQEAAAGPGGRAGRGGPGPRRWPRSRRRAIRPEHEAAAQGFTSLAEAREAVLDASAMAALETEVQAWASRLAGHDVRGAGRGPGGPGSHPELTESAGSRSPTRRPRSLRFRATDAEQEVRRAHDDRLGPGPTASRDHGWPMFAPPKSPSTGWRRRPSL